MTSVLCIQKSFSLVFMVFMVSYQLNYVEMEIDNLGCVFVLPSNDFWNAPFLTNICKAKYACNYMLHFLIYKHTQIYQYHIRNSLTYIITNKITKDNNFFPSYMYIYIYICLQMYSFKLFLGCVNLR